MYKIAIASFFVILFIGVIASWLVGGKLIAPANDLLLEIPTSMPISKIRLESGSGYMLSGWHVKSEQKKGVFVLLHGNRSNKLSMISRAELLYKEGYSSVLIDFQSHGESEGNNITMGFLEKEDVKAAVAFAREAHKLQPVGLIGVSLGGAAAILAGPLKIDVAVLESVYSDISTAIHNRVKLVFGFLSWLPAELLLVQVKLRLGFPRSELSPLKAIYLMGCPVMIISGTEDKHTMLSDTWSLYNNAIEPKKIWLPNKAKHEDLYAFSPAEYKLNVIKFVNEHMHKNLLKIH